MENLALRSATLFDLTDDDTMIEDILGYLPNKADYKKTITDLSRISAMVAFAEEKNDTALLQQLNTVFESELSLLFNE